MVCNFYDILLCTCLAINRWWLKVVGPIIDWKPIPFRNNKIMIRKLLINKYKKKIAKERKVIPDPIETCSLQIIDPQLMINACGWIKVMEPMVWFLKRKRLKSRELKRIQRKTIHERLSVLLLLSSFLSFIIFLWSVYDYDSWELLIDSWSHLNSFLLLCDDLSVDERRFVMWVIVWQIHSSFSFISLSISRI